MDRTIALYFVSALLVALVPEVQSQQCLPLNGGSFEAPVCNGFSCFFGPGSSGWNWIEVVQPVLSTSQVAYGGHQSLKLLGDWKIGYSLAATPANTYTLQWYYYADKSLAACDVAPTAGAEITVTGTFSITQGEVICDAPVEGSYWRRCQRAITLSQTDNIVVNIRSLIRDSCVVAVDLMTMCGPAQALTTAPLTTQALTSGALTTSPLTTQPLTTAPLTTMALTTNAEPVITTTWIFSGAGSWDTATNWDNGVPNANKHAVVGLGYAVTASSGATARSLTISGNGNVILNGTINIPTVTVNQGIIDFRSSAVISSFTLQGSTSYLKIFGGVTVNVTSVFNWLGTSTQITSSNNVASVLNLLASCASNFSASGTQYITYVTVNNYGTLSYSAKGNGMYLYTSSSFNNYGTFDVTATTTTNFYVYGLSNIFFYNQGLLKVNLASGYFLLFQTVTFVNLGTVSVVRGYLDFAGSAVAQHSGVFTTAATLAFIRFTSGTHNLTATSVVTAGSNVIFQGATTTIYGTWLASAIQQVSGTTTFYVIVASSSPTLAVSGGTVTFTTFATFAWISVTAGRADFRANTNVTSLSLSGSSGSVCFSATVAVSDSFIWTGSNNQLCDSLASNGTLILLEGCDAVINGSGSGQYMNYVSLVNYGTVNYAATSYGVYLYSGLPSIINYGVWNVTSSTSANYQMSASSSTTKFINKGTFSVYLLAGYSMTLSVGFQNDGVVSVLRGYLSFSMSGTWTHSGIWNHAPTLAFIQFSSGVHNLVAAGVVNAGPGIIFSGATTNIYCSWLPTYFQHLSGTTTFYVPFSTGTSLTVSGGSLIFSNATSLGSVTVTGGRIDFRSNSIIQSVYLTGTSGNFFVSGATVVVNITQNFVWSGSNNQISSALGVDGAIINLLEGCVAVINGSGSAQYLSYISLVNYGTVTYAATSYGAYLYYGVPSIVNYGDWNVTASVALNSQMSSAYNTAKFINNGNFGVYLLAGYSMTLSVGFQNDGIVNVIRGYLSVGNGGTWTHSGVWNHAPALAFIQFSGGVQNLAASGLVNTGPGIIFNGATTNIYGAWYPTYFQHLSGTTTFYVPFATGTSLIISGGALIFSNATSLGAITITGGRVDFRSSSTIQSVYMTGTSGNFFVSGASVVVNITQNFVWSGSNNQISSALGIDGAVINLLEGCVSVINGSGSAQYLSYVSLVNYGTVTYAATSYGAYLYYGVPSIVNYGDWNVTSSVALNSQMSSAYNTAKFINNGNFGVYLLAGYSMTLSVGFQNDGIVNVIRGYLSIGNGGTWTHSGVWNHAATLAFIQFSGGVQNLAASGIVNVGPGIIFNGATTNIYCSWFPTYFQHLSGTTTFYVPFSTGTSLTISGGALIFSNTTSLGSVTVTGGRIDFRSSSIIQSVYLTGTSGNFFVSGATVVVNITQNFVWSGSNNQISSALGVDGAIINLLEGCVAVINGSGSAQYLSYISLVNYGTVSYAATSYGAYLYYGIPSIVNYGDWNVTSTVALNSQMSSAYNTAKFINNGNFGVYLLAGYSMTLSVGFQNDGVVNVIRGYLSVSNGGTWTHSGAWNHAPTLAFIQFSGGVQILSAISVVNVGPGIIFNGATTNIYGAWYPTYFQHLSGTTTFYVPFSTGTSLTVSGGSLTFSNATYLGSVTVTGGRIDFRSSSVIQSVYLTGTSGYFYVSGVSVVVNITQNFVWSGSNNQIGSSLGVDGAVVNLVEGCVSVINGSGAAQYLSYVSLVNYGVVSYAATSYGAYFYYGTPSIVNYGSWNVSTSLSVNVQMSGAYTTAKFINNGNFVVSLVSGYTLTVQVNFENDGVVNVIRGYFDLSAPSVTVIHGGNWFHSATLAFIRFSGGVHVIGGIFYDGPGVVFSGATVTVTGTFYPVYFVQTSGLVTFNVSINAVSSTTISGGTMIFGVPTTVYAVVVNGGRVDFRANVIVSFLNMTGTSGSVGISGLNVIVNVTTVFYWAGTNNFLVNTYATSGSTINLLPGCQSYLVGAGNAQYLQYVTLYNYGTITYSPSGYGLYLYTLSSFINEGNFDVVSTLSVNIQIYAAATNVFFYNRGSITINVNINYAFYIYANVENHGSISVNQGSLTFAYSGAVTHYGSFYHASTNAWIRFISGSHTLSSTCVIYDGPGIIFAGATTYIYGTFYPTIFVHTSGSTVFYVSITITTTLNLSGGSLHFQASSVVYGIYLSGTSTVLLVSGATTQLNITNTFTWAGTNCQVKGLGFGVINLNPVCNTQIIGSGTSQYLDSVALWNHGTFVYNPTSYGITLVGNGAFSNRVSGVFVVSITITINLVFYSSSPTAVFENHGFISISMYSSSYTFTVQSVFNNLGNFNLTRGGCVFLGAGNHTGNFNGATNVTFSFSGNNTFAPTAIVEGGSISLASGVFVFRGSWTSSVLIISGATVTFDSYITLYFPSIIVTAGSLTFGQNCHPVITSCAPSGGIIVFAGDVTIITLTITVSATVRIQGQGFINYFILRDSGIFYVDQLAIVNIYYTFTWSGTGVAQISSFTSIVGGVINFMPDCVSVFNGASTSHFLSYVVFNNFGVVLYSPTSSGVIIRYGGGWVNHPGSVMNVTSNGAHVNIGCPSSCTGIYFDNHGTINVNVQINFIFRIYVTFRNYGTFLIGTSACSVIGPAVAYQYSGTTIIRTGGSFTCTTFYMSGGYIEGNGNLNCALQHSGGYIRPGGSGVVGTLVILSYVGSGSAVLDLEVTSLTVYDRITVTNAVILPKEIHLNAIGSFTFVINMVFTVLISGNTLTVTSVTITGTTCSFSYAYNGNHINATVISLTPGNNCPGGCDHGTCGADNTCICFDGYSGPKCDQFTCLGGCGVGTCVGPNDCECPHSCTCGGHVCGVIFASNETAAVTTNALTSGISLTTSPLTTAALTTSPLTTAALTTVLLTTGEFTTSPLTTASLTTSPLTTKALTTSPLTTQKLTTQSLTTSPLTTRELTTSPLTTQELTTSPLTTQELTTSPLTTQELTTSPLTTQELTTSPLTTQELTTSPLTTQELTTSPLTTQELTTSPLTTQELTTSPLTTQELTTSPLTTQELTTSPLTTQELTTSPLTTQELTTSPLTTQELTTSPLTTQELTTSPLTTQELTTSPLTTQELTTSPLTTQELTTSPLTTQELTTSPLTTQELTTSPLTTQELTTSPLTTQELTTSPLTTQELTTSPLTTQELTTSPLTTQELTTSPLTTQELTTSPLTTQELTTSPLTTQELTTSPLTTQELTTSPLTTQELTTSPLTTQELTTSPLTTQELTTSPLTTQELTTSPLTTQELTTSPLTTQELTTSPLTTQQLTTSPLTTQQLTTAPLTTQALSTSALTTSPLTTRALTTSPLTTRAVTSGAVTSGLSAVTTGSSEGKSYCVFKQNCAGLDFSIGAAQLSFQDFHVISFGSFVSSMGALDGRLIVRDDATLGNGYSVGQQIGRDADDSHSPYSLVVGRRLAWNSGAVFPDGSGHPFAAAREDIFVGANYSLPADIALRVGGTCLDASCRNDLNLAFDAALSCFVGFQNVMASHADNVNKLIQWSQFSLSCPTQQPTYYVSLTPAEFNQFTYTTIDSNCNPDAAWIINVRGTGDVTIAGGTFPVPSEGALTYNIIGTGRNIKVNSEVAGHILGPQNRLQQIGGVIRGNTIVGDISQSLSFTKAVPCVESS